VDHNGDDGIQVTAPLSLTLTKNEASFNGHLGIEAPDNTAGSKNRARQNGDPRQCVPRYLCGPPGQAKK
jgi:hypothetical protein